MTTLTAAAAPTQRTAATPATRRTATPVACLTSLRLATLVAASQTPPRVTRATTRATALCTVQQAAAAAAAPTAAPAMEVLTNWEQTTRLVQTLLSLRLRSNHLLPLPAAVALPLQAADSVPATATAVTVEARWSQLYTTTPYAQWRLDMTSMLCCFRASTTWATNLFH